MSVTLDDPVLTLVCPSPQALPKMMSQVVTAVEKRGLCILEAWDTQKQTLKTVAGQMGYIMNHIRGDEDGIVDVAYQRSWHETSQSNNEIRKEDFQSYSSDEVPPHSDGAALDGMDVIGDRIVQIGPPQIVIFQCVEPAEAGGELLLVDMKKVLVDLLRDRPDIARILLEPGCVSFCRDNQFALDLPVFQKIGDRWRVRAHCDNRVFVTDRSAEAMQILFDEYINQPQYTDKILLTSRQILVIDNYRILHGRAAYQVFGDRNVRHHRRLWVASDRLPIFQNFQGEVKIKRAFEPYQAYRIVTSLDVPVPYPICCGIPLNDEEREWLVCAEGGF